MSNDNVPQPFCPQSSHVSSSSSHSLTDVSIQSDLHLGLRNVQLHMNFMERNYLMMMMMMPLHLILNILLLQLMREEGLYS